MDNINSKCNNVTHEYKKKYDKLLSLVNGYEKANDTQSENMKTLSGIINNTKELIGESDFNNLKNEQHNIMKDFFQLETLKNDPYSNESVEFLNKKPDNNTNNINNNNNNNINNINNIKNKYSLDGFDEIGEKKKALVDNSPNNTPADNNLKQSDIIKQDEYDTKSPIQPLTQSPQYKQFYPDDEKYKVYSNYTGDYRQQMPSIQIVNVQEAPTQGIKLNEKEKIEKIKEKDINKTVNKFLEKSIDSQNIMKDRNSKKMESIIEKIKTPELKKQLGNIIQSKQPNYKKKSKKISSTNFKNFVEDYTTHMRIPKRKSYKKKIIEPNSKKCHSSKFISKIDNLSNNHSLF
jgi:hypothetical protein